METLKNETEDVLFRKAIKKIPIGYQDPSGKSLTSLIILHSKSPLKHTRLVLQMGYSTTTPDKNGWTPLHHTGLLLIKKTIYFILTQLTVQNVPFNKTIFQI